MKAVSIKRYEARGYIAINDRGDWVLHSDHLAEVARAVAAEREACATEAVRVATGCDAMAERGTSCAAQMSSVAGNIAAAIRARATTPEPATRGMADGDMTAAATALAKLREARGVEGGVRLTEEEHAELVRRIKRKPTTIVINRGELSPPSRNKYGVRTDAKGKAERTRDGMLFASKREARRYDALCLLRTAGEVRWFIRQPCFDTGGGTKYRADFLVVWRNGAVTIEDAKGAITKDFARAKKQVEAAYPIEIELV